MQNLHQNTLFFPVCQYRSGLKNGLSQIYLKKFSVNTFSIEVKFLNTNMIFVQVIVDNLFKIFLLTITFYLRICIVKFSMFVFPKNCVKIDWMPTARDLDNPQP